MSSHAQAPASGLFEHFSRLGVAIIEYGLTAADLAVLDAAFPKCSSLPEGACTAGISRDALDWLAAHEGLAELVFRLAGRPMQFKGVNAVHETPHPTWFAAWHQSALEDSAERPAAALERWSLLLRIHLDDCDEDGGPLEAIPGSHKHGRLKADAISELTATAQPVLCLTVRGDIVALRPLTVRRSQRARRPLPRRVVEVEYTAATKNN
jgi:hypothetical protein